MAAKIFLQLSRYSPHQVFNYEFDLEKQDVHIGSNPNNHIVIDLDTVSGDHAVIFRREGRNYFQDHSTNGTEWLRGNGAKVLGNIHKTTIDAFHKGDSFVFKKIVNGVKRRIYQIKVVGFGE